MQLQHLVSKCHLKNFKITPRKNQIYVYRRNREPFPVSINKIAAEKDFYLTKIKPDNRPSNIVERTYSKMESAVKPILSKIASGSTFNLTENERASLAVFIAHLHTRNASYRQKQKNIVAKDYELTGKRLAQNKEGFHSFVKQNGKYKSLSVEEIEKMRQEMLKLGNELRIGATGGQEFFIKWALESAQLYAPILLDRVWALCESSGPRVFVTSDNPLTLVRPTGKPEYLSDGILTAHIAFPVSPSRCLMIWLLKGGDKDQCGIFRVDRNFVDYVNLHIMFYAHKDIYSNLKSKDIKKEFDQTKDGASEEIIIQNMG